MNLQHLRIARPVTDLEKSCEMYCRGLALRKIGEFSDHDGFSGCMVGRDDLPWHIEFTLCHDHPVSPASSPEDLLVLYIPEQAAWAAACRTLAEAGFIPVPSFNPYWDKQGTTFQDRDGYRLVLQNSRWDI
ncbi:VOC family protein [Mixta sp. Marseille-Q2659]|uniref:VOC family protein n=1 Tax=Mixta sp. Marseille-Q2659 TaxID=2736607 RepID=UPI0023BA2A4A|nr:VOC family protein [Mixta sp. Marseille-Q2659]